ncbi:uncharacterized protein N7503_011728 [Penicillium pulvis]|uniref:uncharacterized protein n=1 Tax=Penicillium pulvis TaxID=1562058 RepID=UPI00254737F5|nr:uncharacterized protein N7503_011728 [Penicillium pulvis]KAJ5786516.1 hypothetical protein N7503_011728 [Penicillium pulvis]
MWLKFWACMAILAGSVAAVTQITDDEMTSLLSAGGADLANLYAPLWFFAQAENQPPLLSNLGLWRVPKHAGHLRRRSQDPSRSPMPVPKWPAFPVYYTFKQCNETEVRVVYNLFYEKDGATFGVIQTGHNYDWERVVIIHSRDDNDMWAPSRALLSAHSGYHNLAWGDIQNTLTTDQINAGDAKDPNGVQDEDHPKVYVAWSKHPNFDTRNTGFTDPISQSLDDAYRSDDWWHYVGPQYYIHSDNSTVAGQALGSADWGSATSNPPLVQASVCDAS